MEEIKKYTPLVWVEVAFWPNVEHLFWEGTETQFKDKMKMDFIYFPIYSRNISTQKIKDFWVVKNSLNGQRELKMAHLEEGQKAQIRELAKQMEKNIGRGPNEWEFDWIIQKVVLWEKKEVQKNLSKLERFKTFLQIKKFKVAKIVTGKIYGFNEKKVW